MAHREWTSREMVYSTQTVQAFEQFVKLAESGNEPNLVDYAHRIVRSLYSAVEKLNPKRVSEIFPFLIVLVLSALSVIEKLDHKKEPVCTLDKLFAIIHRQALKVSSSDDVSRKESAILSALSKYDGSSVFAKLGELLESRLSSKVHLQASFEMSLRLLYMGFHIVVKDESSQQVVENWKSSIRFIGQHSFTTIREIFFSPLVLCSRISLSTPYSVSLAVLHGLLETTKNESHNCKISVEQQLSHRSQVPALVYWPCPAKFKIPHDDINAIQELSEILRAFLDVSCPRDRSSVLLPLFVEWWYWLLGIVQEVL
ncbi:hypothetical protein Pelo_1620 [Pelomyxa schiedti]|nr:hypothetical protein Pelo_1620 [Pelomyxa schiedti]